MVRTMCPDHFANSLQRAPFQRAIQHAHPAMGHFPNIVHPANVVRPVLDRLLQPMHLVTELAPHSGWSSANVPLEKLTLAVTPIRISYT